jgi:capsule polysaccharide export protein KpsE/RkpR
LFNEDSKPAKVKEEKEKIKKVCLNSYAVLDLVAICPIFLLLFFSFFSYSDPTTTRFFLDVRIKKGEGRVVTDLQPLSLLLRFSQLSVPFLSILFL